jgi:hypothetical protein
MPISRAWDTACGVATTMRSTSGCIQKSGGKSARSVITMRNGVWGHARWRASASTPLKFGMSDTITAGCVAAR